jgi:hypothetical protein
MGNAGKTLLFIIIAFISPILLHSQISGTNLMETQVGKLPGDSSAIATIYDRAVVNYTCKGFKAGVSLEQFYTKFNKRNFIKPTQYSLQYSSDAFEVKIGSFYETIGRGILLRSYEMPEAILEDLSYRSRYYFLRDIIGLGTKFRHKNFSLKILYGKPLNNIFPPILADSIRRPDLVKAIYSDYTFKKQTFGASVLQLHNKNGSTAYGMVTASGILFPFMSYYTELAKNVSDFKIKDFTKRSSYALYASTNLTFNKLGISAEYKNYNNFIIGAGINEPPALVKEFSYIVLNRSIHVLQPINESGYQIEVYYTFSNLATLTINNSLAINDLWKKFVYQEYFVEYAFSLNDKHEVKLFADYAEDPFKLISNRISTGVYFEWKTQKASVINSDYEFQIFNRSGIKVQNHVLSLGYAYNSKFILSITGELSTDPFLTDNKLKVWPGTNVKYRINDKNSVQFFAGRRRGRPACNAGVCYNVLDFYGVELRVTSRF